MYPLPFIVNTEIVLYTHLSAYCAGLVWHLVLPLAISPKKKKSV